MVHGVHCGRGVEWPQPVAARRPCVRRLTSDRTRPIWDLRCPSGRFRCTAQICCHATGRSPRPAIPIPKPKAC